MVYYDQQPQGYDPDQYSHGADCQVKCTADSTCAGVQWFSSDIAQKIVPCHKYWSVPAGLSTNPMTREEARVQPMAPAVFIRCNALKNATELNCTAGSYGPAGVVGSTNGTCGCQNCSLGWYQPLPASPTCLQCPAGKTTSGTGSTGCNLNGVNNWAGIRSSVKNVNSGDNLTINLMVPFDTSDYDSHITIQLNTSITIFGNGAVLDALQKGCFFFVMRGALALHSLTLQNGYFVSVPLPFPKPGPHSAHLLPTTCVFL
jgi:hypothetical protein